MPNMSYCRFQNTNNDVRDCEGALEALLNGEDKLSAEELEAAKYLVQKCAAIVQMVADFACVEVTDLTEEGIECALQKAQEDVIENEDADEGN